jgi:hypothetical protein
MSRPIILLKQNCEEQKYLSGKELPFEKNVLYNVREMKMGVSDYVSVMPSH